MLKLRVFLTIFAKNTLRTIEMKEPFLLVF